MTGVGGEITFLVRYRYQAPHRTPQEALWPCDAMAIGPEDPPSLLFQVEAVIEAIAEIAQELST